ncbi:ROK family protein [Actinoplanes teichomyceticus]|uniref:Putative NBD/HSP70 family sugar kinase n=1 Tax=Actinoplanes teichomyceticus TaxID=1867 RepID=A0A561WBA6_ACTTI|nr:ROK family protein [Actinoplanes teichomyceticus]TWG21141.1 putative NBD/HSP70 family sugar kinase [Actinoplanes teichomyceticus]GIF14962.1 sugar kinase [Actinoplanes teichomyceticus]
MSVNQHAVRRRNLGALLRYVHLRGAASRAELTSELGLNRSTIGALAAELAAAGLVREDAPRASGRAGRPSPVVRTNTTGCYAYALTVEADRLRAARVGLGGDVLDARTLARSPGAGLGATLRALAGLARALRPVSGALLGCAVAIAGRIRGGAHGPELDAYVGETLGDELGLDRPAQVGNLADLAALAEHTRGAAVGLDDVVHLHGDGGINAGLIIGGRGFTGHNGIGAQAGHMVVNPDGRPCRCGSRGCWEAEIDAAGTDGPDTRRAAEWLGHGVANLVNILNPEAVVFGGTLTGLYRTGHAEVRARVRAMALPACRTDLRLSAALLGDDAPLIGAAELAFEPVLDDPLSTAA